MWKLTPADLLQLKGGGGERFGHFVDRLIRGEAAKAGPSQAEIKTQLRMNIRDGGIDTQVDKAIAGTKIGWFEHATCWQYKAVESAAIDDKRKEQAHNDLQKEINKPYARQLIERGYAYRFCLLGDLPPSKRADWEGQLLAEAQRINPSAAEPRVVDGGDLLAWAELFPAVVAWLRNSTQKVFHWEAWRQNSLAVTKVYVPNPDWEEIEKRILQHVDFNAPCVGGDPCLEIGGAAGVGKTRLVSETLNALGSASAIVLYAADEQGAKWVATDVANNPSQICILVADECSELVRHFLNENLRGHAQRIRVICLDNAAERISSISSQVWLSADSLTNTGAILEANFPDVPADRRHHYATLSRGFVRLAADMCQRDMELAGGDISQLLGSVEQYVKRRLQSDDLPLICMISLFHKIGFGDEVRADLDALCGIAGCSPQKFRDAIRVVRESPGFVVQAGRYWYVTPEIVSQVLFTEGWRRWVSDDPVEFLKRLPDHLQRQLIDRAGKLGGEEVRAGLAPYFRRWFDRLSAESLSDPHTTSLACAIVEARPEEYLPKLRRVFENASRDEILAIREHADGERWGPRRTLVWALERLVSFPEFFHDCESCLFRLALDETEHQISNSATGIWRNLFSVDLPGTASSFQDRCEVLRKRTDAPTLEEAALAFSGLARVFGPATGHDVGPPVVAGRLRPPDWSPSTAANRHECHLAALRICAEHFKRGDSTRRALAFELIIDHLDFLLARSFLEELADIFDPKTVSEEESRGLANAIDRYLALEALTGRDRASDDAARCIEAVRRWRDAFRPDDLDGRLRSICSRDPWNRQFSGPQERRDNEIDELARTIVADAAPLQLHLDWLASNEARSAQCLGIAIGRIDEESVAGGMIFEHAILSGTSPLLRGYIAGLVSSRRQPTDELLDLMSRLESAYPELAIEILSYAGDDFDALNRAIRLVEAGDVSPRVLAGFATRVGGRKLSADEVSRLLPYFSKAASSGDAGSAHAGLHFLWHILSRPENSPGLHHLESRAVRTQVWILIEAALPFVDNQTDYVWSTMLVQLVPFDKYRAAGLLGQALLSESYNVVEQAQRSLVKLASDHPDAVITGLGKALLDESNGWRLQMTMLRDIVEDLPPPVVANWIRSYGIEAARAIARHLPRPCLTDAGEPVVPELLDIVLRDFDDDRVFGNFLSGCHSEESWWEDGSEKFRREAEVATRFLDHPNHRVREWARYEMDFRLAQAESEQRHYAERLLPS